MTIEKFQKRINDIKIALKQLEHGAITYVEFSNYVASGITDEDITLNEDVNNLNIEADIMLKRMEE